MGRSTPTNPEKANGGIPTLFVVWLICLGAAIACYYFLPPSGESQESPTYGLNRAVVILGLGGFAILDSIIAAVKTFKRRRVLGLTIKSLGYCPFFFTTGSLGTLLQRILIE